MPPNATRRLVNAASLAATAMSVFFVTASNAFAGVPSPVPEPATLSLLAVGAVGTLIASRRKRRKD